MKITDISTHKVSAPLKTPFITSLREVNKLEDVVVVIECSNGLIGYGEGASTPIITGETIGSIMATIDYISQFLIGKDIEEFDDMIKIISSVILHNTTAKSALVLAIYDLKAKSQNLPLYKMLGGEETRFETDITISLRDIDNMLLDVKSAINLGYDSFKIKLGNKDINKDIDTILAINSILLTNSKLRLDANQAWSKEESVYILTQIEKKGIFVEFVEQPTKADDFEALKYIKDRVQTPILADESIFTYNDAKRLLESKSIDFINIKLAKTGGITDAIKIANLAKEYNTKCMIGCMLEGAISISSALHFTSAFCDTITMIDLDGVNLLSSNPIKGNTIFNEKELILSDDIGLGVYL